MTLPNRIFFSGAPGSHWNRLAQILENIPGFNTSDRSPSREHLNENFSHLGAFFSRGMEFEALLNPEYIDSAWTSPGGTKLVKGHDWVYKLELIKQVFPDDWIVLVHRPAIECFAWHNRCGGFNIPYPNYQVLHKDNASVMYEIHSQNKAMLDFGRKHNITWEYFSKEWLQHHFDYHGELIGIPPDSLLAVIK